jgi:uncharacterized protein YjdB
MTIARLVSRVAPLGLAFAMLACGGKDGPNNPVAVATVTVSQGTATLVPTSTVQLSATPKDAAGNTLTREVTWTSSDQARATVSPAGLVTGVAVGTATITATSDSRTAQAVITVKEGGIVGTGGATLLALGGNARVSIPAGAVAAGTMVTVETATGAPADARLIAATAIVLGPSTLTFAQPADVSIKYLVANLPAGPPERLLRLYSATAGSWSALTGNGVDETAKMVTAKVSGGSTLGILAPAAVTSVVVSPISWQLTVGGTQTFVATPRDVTGAALLDPVRDASWVSSEPSVASVDPSSGVVTGIATGSAILSATIEGKTGMADVSVVVRTVEMVAVDPPTASVAAGANTQLAAVLRDVSNNVISGPPVTWTSGNPAIARVSELGLVTGVAPGGPVTITASSQGRGGTAAVTVTAPVDPCDVTNARPIALGQTLNGLLASTACRLGDGSYADVYRLTVAATATVRIDMTSTAFDTYLGLFNSQLALLDEDDNDGGDRNARIGRTLTPDTYYILANSFSAAMFGAYQLAITVVPPPSGAVVNQGNDQAGMAGVAVPLAPSIVVRDLGGSPVQGLTVTFAATEGEGTVNGGVVTTNAEGVATVGSWILGADAGPNTMTATVSGSGIANNPLTFHATGCSGGDGAGYAITVCYVTSMTSAQRSAFQTAAARWAELITADLPGGAITLQQNNCGTGSPALNGFVIDDLLIFAKVEPIDGPEGILGSAGPCVFRSIGGIPAVGTMRFDAEDLAMLEQEGQLVPVILHEMGHVIGFGTRWVAKGLLQSPTTVDGPLPPPDTYFNGVNGIAGFNLVGGDTYTAGQKVPVENVGGVGSLNGHWRENVLANELMTSGLNAGTNMLSVLTVRSLQDLGYEVNAAAADPFHLALSLRAGGPTSGKTRWFVNDIYTGPQFQIDLRGRLTRLR